MLQIVVSVKKVNIKIAQQDHLFILQADFMEKWS